MIGQTISHYKITAKLGEGGMGVVYKAEDTKLERTVALKFLAAHLLQDQEARKRFVREAKAAAALDHPHICTVYEIDEAEGRTFISMAFVEGQSLDAKIGAGPLKLNDILDLARQVAEGLQDAHSHGIVHRDVKPQNILISAKSGAKQHATIMDFGLAHLTEQSKLTQKDTSLGTVAYMSPEQTMGAEVDRRTDIWALGCVIHEMVCGEQPFKGHYAQAVTYAILNEEPEPLTALRTAVPMELEWIVGKCLAKEADSRYQNAGELAVDLKNLQDKLKSGRSTFQRTSAPAVSAGVLPVGPATRGAGAISEARAAAPPPAWKRYLPWSLFVVSALAALVLALVHFREAPPDNPAYELTLDLPPGTTLHTYSLSPDGRHVALALRKGEAEQSSLWVRFLDSIEPRELPGTQGAQYPFWSPDSRHIGFFAQGKLKKVALAGGPPQSLCDAGDGRGGTWNAEGVIVFAPAPFGEIQRVADGGGEPAAVTTVDESAPQVARRFPWFLPDGKHFLYTAASAGPDQAGIYLGSIEGSEPRRLLPDDSNAVYARGTAGQSGFILFFREETLMAQPLDPGRVVITGDVFPVAESIGGVANLGHYGFSVATSGALLYVRGSGAGPPQSQLAWVDRAGKQPRVLGKPANLIGLSLSPDDTRAALTIVSNAAPADIWLFEFARGTMLRFTADPGPDILPVWSPDGRHIAFSSMRAGSYGLYRKDAGGAEEEAALISNAGTAGAYGGPYVSDWSPGGLLLYVILRPRTKRDLWVLPIEDDRKPYAYLDSEFQESQGRFSPDGRWVAYASDESGRPEVYVRPFPAADRKWQISTQGGSAPVWSKDGRELYYIDPGRNLMAVALKMGDEIEAGDPKALFQTRLPGLSYGLAPQFYDVSRDGQFLIANRIDDGPADDQRTLVMVSDWRAKVGK